MSAGPVYPYRDRSLDHLFRPDAAPPTPEMLRMVRREMPSFKRYVPIVHLTPAELRTLAEPQEEVPCTRRSE